MIIYSSIDLNVFLKLFKNKDIDKINLQFPLTIDQGTRKTVMK